MALHIRSLLGPTRKIFLTTLGLVLLLGGVILSFTPGPGLLLLAGGLAVLSREYVWAEKLLTKAKAKFNKT